MNNKLVGLVAVALLVAVGFGGYFAGKSNSQNFGGATFGPAAAGGLRSVYNILESLLQDVTNVRTVVSNATPSSTSWNPGTITATSGQGGYATTSFTGLSSSITVAGGDWCAASLASSTLTSGDLNLPLMTCFVSGTGQVTVKAWIPTSTLDINATLVVQAFDVGTFTAPSALVTATSSTAGQ